MRLSPGKSSILAALVAAAAPCGIGAALSAADEIAISQKNKQFQPSTVTIQVGQVMVIANDDDPTVHHAYVESDHFNFDSGDQKPGSHTKITFPAKGDYQVLCGIHPNMKLDVHVK